MSNSYDKHKNQVEQARKRDGKFGSYEAGESGTTLAPAQAAQRTGPTDDELASSIDSAMEGRQWQAADVGQTDGVQTFGLADAEGNKLVEVRNDNNRGFHEIWDHSAEAPRMVSSTKAGYASADQIAYRAAEHYDALSSGRDPLGEAQPRPTHSAQDGLPDSYFDLTETTAETQAAARELNTLGQNEGWEVAAVTTGGGNEAFEIAESGDSKHAPGAYGVMVCDMHGSGDLDQDGWGVYASYQDADGEWIEDDDELAFEPIEIEDSSDTEALKAAVMRKMSDAHRKSEEAHGW